MTTSTPTKTKLTDSLDRLSADPSSPYYNKEVLRKIGVKVNGVPMPSNVREFCVSEGWVDVQRKVSGKWEVERRTGVIVEPFERHNHQQNGHMTAGDHERLAAAEAKRQRKAAKLRSLSA